MIFADGAQYVGEFKGGRLHGLGRYTGRTGEVVEGLFQDGVLHGPGRVETPLPGGGGSGGAAGNSNNGGGSGSNPSSGPSPPPGAAAGGRGGEGSHGVGRMGVTEAGTFERGLLEGSSCLKLFKEKYLHQGNFEKGELHKYGRLVGWLVKVDELRGSII
jgi:hypothetical protein